MEISKTDATYNLITTLHGADTLGIQPDRTDNVDCNVPRGWREAFGERVSRDLALPKGAALVRQSLGKSRANEMCFDAPVGATDTLKGNRHSSVGQAQARPPL